MNTKNGMLLTLTGVVLMVCFIYLAQSTNAQSMRGVVGLRGNSQEATSAKAAKSNCKKLKGTRIDLYDPTAETAFGAIHNGGFLNGTTADVINFSTFVIFTPDPNIFTYLSDTTITTINGQVKVTFVTTQNGATGIFTQWGSINPETSTGIFAGATGVIYMAGKSIGDPANGPFQAEVLGEVCFPK